MNDWSYACTAKLLAAAILDGTKPPAAMAGADARHGEIAAASVTRSHLIQRGQQILADVVGVLEPA